MKKILMLAIAILLVLATAPAAQASAETFRDIESHWAKSKIEQAIQKGYVSGYTDNTFRPENQVTRAEFIRLIVDALQLPNSKGGSPWYQGYVAAALEFDILEQSDFSDYTAPITRLEIMRLLARAVAISSQYAELLDAYSGLYSGDIPYIDYRDIPAADVPYVALVIGSEMVSGYPDFSLGLNKTAKRSEAIVMIENLLATMLKTPDANRGLLELKEVAETGTNATTVSRLVPLFNYVTEPVIEKTSKYDAKLKRSYVLPSRGKLSMFDRLMLWDRTEVDPAQFEEHIGFVFSVFEVSVKKDFNFGAIGFHTNIFPVIYPTTKEGDWLFTAYNAFAYYQPRYETKLVKFKAGETYDVVVYSRYSNPSVNERSTGLLMQSEGTGSTLIFINNKNKGE